MRPDYVNAYNLKNLKALQRESVVFANATVGHYPSVTVAGHSVLAQGVWPSRLIFADRLFQDADGVLGPKHQWYLSHMLSADQFRALLEKYAPRRNAMALLKKKLGGKFLAVGEKSYATFLMGGLDADILVTLQRAKGGGLDGWCLPAGVHVPEYILKPEKGRFYLDCNPENHHGTMGTLSPLKGNQYVPGSDPAHLGGDIWAMDTALTLMEKEKDWRFLFVTLAGIDKLGHIFGEMDNPKMRRRAENLPYNLAKVLKIADEQVGRLAGFLKSNNLWDETLFLVTADHGGFSGEKNFYGSRSHTKEFDNCYFGDVANNEKKILTPLAAKWIQNDRVDHAFLDTAISVWLVPEAKRDMASQCRYFARVPGVATVYQKSREGNRWRYERCVEGPSQKGSLGMNPVAVLNTYAHPHSADLVLALGEETSYCQLGDHGGLQEKSQQIPMILHATGLQSSKSTCPIRLVDVMPALFSRTGVPIPEWMDGTAECIQGR